MNSFINLVGLLYMFELTKRSIVNLFYKIKDKHREKILLKRNFDEMLVEFGKITVFMYPNLQYSDEEFAEVFKELDKLVESYKDNEKMYKNAQEVAKKMKYLTSISVILLEDLECFVDVAKLRIGVQK